MKEIIIKCYNDSINVLPKVIESIRNKEKLLIVTLNPEGVMTSLEKKELYNLYMSSNALLVCESNAIQFAIKQILRKEIKVYPGIELLQDILYLCQNNNYSIYLYGAKEEVISELNKKLHNNKINVIGYSNGYHKNEKEQINKIIALKPNIVVAALGVYKQEMFLNNLLNKSTFGIMIGVGGAFDVLSGCKKRAPKIFIKLKLEWLYRIIKEPKRIKKFINKNIKFCFLVLRGR